MAAQQAAEWSAAGAMGVALAVLGVEPGGLWLAILGSGAWIVLTTSMSRWRALACFVFASPFGALVGQAAALHFAGGGMWVRIASFLAALAAVPLLRALLAVLDARAGELVGSAFDRIAAVLKGRGDGR